MSVSPLTSRHTMKVLDYDETTNHAGHPEGREETRQALLRDADNSIDVVCSGRGPTMLRALAGDLAGFPLDAVSTNNGQDLFINHKGVPAEQFISHLKLGDASTGWDAGWQKQVEQSTGGWSVAGVRDMLISELKHEGFKPAAPLPAPRDSFTSMQKIVDGKAVLVSVPPDQPGFQVRYPGGRIEDSATHEKFGRQLSERISQQLSARGIHHTCYSLLEGGSTEKGIPHDRYTHQITPEGVTKADLTNYLATRYPSVRFVVAAGDAPNDKHIEMREAGPQQAEVYAILAGEHHPNADEIRQHPRVISTPPGSIGPAINQHVEAIHEQLPAYPSARLGTMVSTD